MGDGRSQYADMGRGKYAAILKKRAGLEQQAAADANGLRLPERVFLQFSRKIDDAMPDRLETARKDCLRDLRQKSKIAHWLVTRIPPLGRMRDKRLKDVYTGLAQGAAADNLHYCLRRSVEDIERRNAETETRKRKAAKLAVMALEKALAGGVVLEAPITVRRPLQLKP